MPFLFSYGTLQHEDVQRATFGRTLRGEPDELVGFARDVATTLASGREAWVYAADD